MRTGQCLLSPLKFLTFWKVPTPEHLTGKISPRNLIQTLVPAVETRLMFPHLKNIHPLIENTFSLYFFFLLSFSLSGGGQYSELLVTTCLQPGRRSGLTPHLHAGQHQSCGGVSETGRTLAGHWQALINISRVSPQPLMKTCLAQCNAPFIFCDVSNKVRLVRKATCGFRTALCSAVSKKRMS